MVMILNSEIQNFKQLKQILCELWVPEVSDFRELLAIQSLAIGGKLHFEPNQCAENAVV